MGRCEQMFSPDCELVTEQSKGTIRVQPGKPVSLVLITKNSKCIGSSWNYGAHKQQAAGLVRTVSLQFLLLMFLGDNWA